MSGSSVVGNAIRGNAIYSNGDLGIYAEPGVDIPVLTSAKADEEDNLLSISGVLTGTPNTDYELDFFVSEQCDPSGEGEGQSYVGSLTLIGTPSGVRSFIINFPGSYAAGHFLTATATDEDDSSSQFSRCRAITTDQEFHVYLPLLTRGAAP
ncbi:MAG: hypothetical protein P8129_11145 [Anaerolineae bacterium]